MQAIRGSQKTAEKCPLCQEKLPKDVDLKEHLALSHNGVRVECGFSRCEFSSVEIEEIKDHLNLKHYKPLKCTSCSQVCFNNDELNSHVAQTHLTNCPYCTFSTKFEASLDVHVKDKHPEAKESHYACEICDYWTISTVMFEKHLKVQHSKAAINEDEMSDIEEDDVLSELTESDLASLVKIEDDFGL